MVTRSEIRKDGTHRARTSDLVGPILRLRDESSNVVSSAIASLLRADRADDSEGIALCAIEYLRRGEGSGGDVKIVMGPLSMSDPLIAGPYL